MTLVLKHDITPGQFLLQGVNVSHLDKTEFIVYYLVMKMVNIAEFKTHISKYIAAVENGEEVLIARRNIPVARIVLNGRPAGRNRTRLGALAHTVVKIGDVVSPAFATSEWGALK